MSTKKKILLVSDDFRTPTGVATMSKLILKHATQFDWVQLAGARKHPEGNKIIDFDNPKLRMYTASEGYGNIGQFKEIIEKEKPDGVLFFTDPRYFEHHFRIEYEIRKSIPFMFYTIWDNYPLPFYNFGHYNSCDGLFCISKQTKKIVEGVLGEYKHNKVITHVPHGIETDLFSKKEVSINEFKQILPKMNPKFMDFTFLWSNKNMSRKRPSDVIMAFDMLMNKYPDLRDGTHLVMNTNPVDPQNGTDLITIIEEYTHRDLNIHFVNNGSLSREQMPIMYNIADVVICNSDAEGHGLSVTEALMCEKPVIATVTGGLQDQMGFKETSGASRNRASQLQRYSSDDSIETMEHGDWVFPLYPDSSNLIGSVITPYIYEDRASILNVFNRMEEALFCKNLEERGKNGRKWMIENGYFYGNMAKKLTESINLTLVNFKPRKENESIIL